MSITGDIGLVSGGFWLDQEERGVVGSRINNLFAHEPFRVSVAGNGNLDLSAAPYTESYYTIVTISSDADAGTVTLPIARKGKVVIVNGNALTGVNDVQVAGDDAGGGGDYIYGATAEVAGDTNDVLVLTCISDSSVTTRGAWIAQGTA